jgi:hypothetical protein
MITDCLKLYPYSSSQTETLTSLTHIHTHHTYLPGWINYKQTVNHTNNEHYHINVTKKVLQVNTELHYSLHELPMLLARLAHHSYAHVWHDNRLTKD